MKQLLSPKSVAVIGVSRDPVKIGQIVFDNLLSGFSGKIFGVNPNAEEILGQKIYKSVFDISGEVDLAIICVPEKIVAQVLESCGKKKIAVAIIISAGFSEAGSSGRQKEKEILEVAARHNIRILGPNCLGVINNFSGLNASFAAAKLPAKYKVGFFSQSGAMGAAMLDFANGNNFGFSYFVSLGNKIDVSEVDLINSWKDDKNVEVAIGYIEDIKEGSEFLTAAKEFTQKKPLIILKGGMTKEGSQAAHSHTAALASDEIVFEAAMNQSGVILARNMADLLELAIAFSAGKKSKGKNLAIISNAGGPSVLAADACQIEEVNLAKLAPNTIQEIASKTQAASIENPIDLRGDAKSDDFKVAISACEKDKNVDGILIIATPQAMTELENIAWETVWAFEKSKKPIYVNFIGGEIVAKAKDICLESGLPFFSFPERAVRAFRFQSAFENRIKQSQRKTALSKHPKHKAVKSLINFSSQKLSWGQIMSICRTYGIPIADSYLVQNEKELIIAFRKISDTVVLKISSSDIKHKTDVGGVMLGIGSEEKALTAYKKILNNVKKACPDARVEGVTVTKMVKEDSIELIVGAKRDPIFGPVLMFGFGGIFTELIADFSVILTPFTAEKVQKMIENTAASQVIKGYRSQSGYKENALIKVILSLGQLILDHKEINQVEINPLVLEEDGSAIGLDAKIELQK